MLRINLFLILIVLFFTCKIQGASISFDEKFSLAENRAETLKELIPGSEDFYYYSCLFHQQQKEFDKVEEILRQWIKRYSYTSRVEEIKNRQALLTYKDNPNESIKRITDRLNLLFHHEKKHTTPKTSFSSKLNENLISFEALKNQAMRDYSDLSGFENSALFYLSQQNLTADQRRNLLQRLARPEGNNLAQMVVSDLLHKYSGGFGSMPIHNKLVLEQLDECLDLMPDLINQTNFVMTYLARLQPSEDQNWQQDQEAKYNYLMKMWQFARKLSPSFNSLKAHLAYHLLDLDRKSGRYNKILFIEYLKLPRSMHYMNDKYCDSRENRNNRANLNANYKTWTLMPSIGNDEPLVRDYFANFFIEENDPSPYFKFVDSNYLNRLYAETKITNGIGDMEKWFSMLTPMAVNELKEKIELEFLPDCPELFKPSEEVFIKVRIKNIEKLIVKTYHINSLNFYRENLSEVTTAIDLDGLVANEEKTINFNQPGHLSHVEKFSFSNLPPRGIFVIELIGNGISSRALVRKGQLQYMSRNSSAGQILTVFNESGEHVKTAAAWMDGREYKADEQGEIAIPYSTNPGQRNLILINENFASLSSFDHIEESYQLDGGFYVDRETLIEGKKAKVVFRPYLRVNHERADIALLKEARLQIRSVDREGVAAAKEVENFKLFNDKESVYEFTVPEKLSEISFTITGKIDNLSQNKKEDLSLTRSFRINEISNTDNTEAFVSKMVSGSYQVYLLGHSGEPVKNRPIQLEIKAKHFKRTVHLTLQTNQAGFIELGSLKDIAWVRVSAQDCRSHNLYPTKRMINMPTQLAAQAGESIEIPLCGSDDIEKNEVLSLFEIRNNNYVRNCDNYARIASGFIHIEKLPAGDFELYLRQIRQVIQIKVADGPRKAGYIISEKRIISTGAKKPLQILAVKEENASNNLVIRLANITDATRVQITGTRFLPQFSMFSELGSLNRSEPEFEYVIRPVCRFLSGRNIGDEYKYILERKYARIFPGNMLKRPGLLLNPWSLRKTDTSVQQAAGGDAWGAVPEAEPQLRGGKARAGRKDQESSSDSGFANLDFLSQEAATFYNLVPDENGLIILSLNKLSPGQIFHIMAIDGEEAVYECYSSAENEEQYKDICMKRALDPQQNFSEQKNISVISKDEKFTIKDITTAKIEVYDSLSAVYRLYSTLNPDPKLVEFSFITNWNQLEDEKKLELYSKFACHELNFFIYKKDQAFFKRVVKPYIAHKRDKTFMDHWLLNEKLDQFLEPWAFSRLNIVEKILLGSRLEKDSENIKRHVEDLFDLQPVDIEGFNLLFKTALKGSALEADDRLGLNEAMELVGGIVAPSKPLPPPAPVMAKKSRRAMAPSASESRLKDDFDDAEGFAISSDMAFEEKEEAFDGLSLERDSRRRDEIRQLFKQLDTTEEWVENNYYKLPIESQVADLISVNDFWKDFACNPADAPFYSKNFARASRNFPEMMFALSVLDLPFRAADHKTTYEATKMELLPDSNAIIFHREIKPVKDMAKTQSILTSQNFFARNDRYYYEKNERFDKFITEEFLTRRVYGCQVVLTNPTSSRKNVDVLLQIPNGAIPVVKGFYTKSLNFQLEPFSTKTYEYYFYFPHSGTFAHYPVHVSEEETMIATARPFVFKVVDELTSFDKTSWEYVSQNATSNEVIDFLMQNNIERLDLSLMAFRLKEKSFFMQVYDLLKQRHIFHEITWSYGIYHRHPEAMREFLEHSDFAQQCGTTIRSELLTIDPVSRHFYQHKEYWPLVNARVYPLGKKREILNKQLAQQYQALIADLRYHDSLDDYDRLALAYYMLLQDRIEEADGFFRQIGDQNLVNSIQYQYMKAWFAFTYEKPEEAMQIAENYKDYPVIRWQNLFADVLTQAGEITGAAAKIIDDENREQKTGVLADTQPGFEFRVENRQIQLTYQNLKTVSLNYYLMDIELLFSRKPFVQEVSGQFSVIQPNLKTELQLDAEKGSMSVALPPEYRDRNVMVEISGAGITRNQAYFPHSLALNLAEQYGQIRVCEQQSGKSLAKVYVKVYARLKNGQIVFFKDGYTDLRGKFDYASLSTNQLDSVERFAILIMSEDHGSVVREAAPPNR